MVKKDNNHERQPAPGASSQPSTSADIEQTPEHDNTTKALKRSASASAVVQTEQCSAVKKQILSPPQFTTAETSDVDVVLQSLVSCHSITTQFERLINQLQLTSDDYASRNEICDQLKEFFSTSWPDCTIAVFGSGATGCAFRGADLDLSISSSSFNMDRKCHVDIIKRLVQLLQESPEIYGEVTDVCQARCPIVKAIHRPTGLHIDISIHNILACVNSSLVRHLMSTDSRVKQLMFALRVYFKKHQLTGTLQLFSSYAVNLLVVFYLQNVRPPVLPSVEHLAQVAAENEEMLVDGWNCTFTTDPSHLLNSNTLSAKCLLSGFFDFYASLDWGSVVLSVRRGQAVARKTFKVASSSQHFKLTTVCLQDPFDQSHNVTKNISSDTCDRFAKVMKMASTRSSERDFSMVQLGGLLHVLVPTTQQQLNTAQAFYVEFSAPPDLPLPGDQQLQNSSPLDAWYQQITATVENILVEILEFNVVGRSSPSPEMLNELHTMNMNLDVNNAATSFVGRIKDSLLGLFTCGTASVGSAATQVQSQLLMSADCTSTLSLWHGRGSVTEQLLRDDKLLESVLENERLITQALKDSQNGLPSPADGQLTFEIAMSTKELADGCTSVVAFLLSSDKELPRFFEQFQHLSHELSEAT